MASKKVVSARRENTNESALPEKKFKWNKKKIIAASIIGVAILSAIIFAVLVFALDLGPLRPIKSSELESTVVGQVADFEVKYEELRYITLTYRTQIEGKMGKYDGLDGDGKAEFEAELESLVLENLENNYVVLSLCKKLGINTDSKELDRYVQDQLELFVDEVYGGDKKEYKKWLSDSGLTDSFVRLIYKVDRLESLLLQKIVEEKKGIEYGEENVLEFVSYATYGDDYVRTIHAFYPKKSDVVDTSKSYQRATAALSELRAVRDNEARLAAMKIVIGNAPFVSGISTTGDGVYFTYGQLEAEYESAAFALEEYGVSDVVETDDGYYVIMVLPREEEYVRKNLDTLLSQYHYSVLKGMLDGEREEISFTPNEYFEGLSLIDIE